MVKKLEDYIKKAFTDVGFSDEEIVNGCWLLEKGGKQVAWIALHKFLERVAQRANIVFDEPKVFNCTETEVAIYVNGKKGDNTAWSVGEASKTNCTNAYRWAMAEKRAKDRVILKLLGIAGDMYSEEEADEFKKGSDEFQKEVIAQRAKDTKAMNKRIEEHKNTPDGLKERFISAIGYINKLPSLSLNDEALMKSVNDLLAKLSGANMLKEKEELEALVDSKMPKQDTDTIPY